MKIVAGYDLYWAAKQFASREAIIFGEQRVSYEQIDERSNRLANALLDFGLAPGDRIAVLLNNCVECVETVFAITKAGLAYVALNARHTAIEHAEIIRDSGASVVIFGQEFANEMRIVLARSGDEIVNISLGNNEAGYNYEHLIRSASSIAPMVELDDSSTSRIIYTSGTTGTPKGIRYSYARHYRRQENFFAALEYGLGIEHSMVHVGPLTHAAGNYLIPYFLRGARNVILSSFEPISFLSTIENEKITHLLLVPTMLVRLLDYIDKNSVSFNISSLERINYGTASTPPHVLRRGIEVFGSIFRQHYGMSEAPQPLTILYPHEHEISGDGIERLASCGRPTQNVNIVVRDPDGNELPVGEDGEITIKAVGVAAIEYWNNPTLLEETVRDGWFYTGDIGRIDDLGFLYIVGRVKDMIITGGFNVFSREVENALLQNSKIKDAAVFGCPDDEWGEVVVAAIVTEPNYELSASEAINDCRKYIASYKKPREVLFIEEIPRNNSGKIDKNELKRLWSKGN